jgi:hypothetical protein
MHNSPRYAEANCWFLPAMPSKRQGAQPWLLSCFQAGMTITFKPALQLHFNTLLAATSSQAQVASGSSQHYLLAASAPSSSSNSSSSGIAGLQRKHSSQLAIWDGQHLLLCELHQGTDPSQRRIDQLLNARALMMYGSRGSSKQLEGKQQQQCQDAEQQRRALTRLQPVLLGNAEDACGDSSCAALIQSKSHPLAHSKQRLSVPFQSSKLKMRAHMNLRCLQSTKRFAVCHVAAGPPAHNSKDSSKQTADSLQGVAVAINPLADAHTQQAHPRLCASGTPDSEQQPQLGSQTEQEAAPAVQDSFWQQLALGDEAFLSGRWQESEAAYKEALPVSAGHLVSVSSSMLWHQFSTSCSKISAAITKRCATFTSAAQQRIHMVQNLFEPTPHDLRLCLRW